MDIHEFALFHYVDGGIHGYDELRAELRDIVTQYPDEDTEYTLAYLADDTSYAALHAYCVRLSNEIAAQRA